MNEQALANSPQQMVLCPKRDCRSALIAWNQIPVRCVLCKTEILFEYPEPHERDVVVNLVKEMRKNYGETAVMVFHSLEDRIAWEKKLWEDLQIFRNAPKTRDTERSISDKVAEAFRHAIDSGIARIGS